FADRCQPGVVPRRGVGEVARTSAHLGVRHGVVDRGGLVGRALLVQRQPDAVVARPPGLVLLPAGVVAGLVGVDAAKLDPRNHLTRSRPQPPHSRTDAGRAWVAAHVGITTIDASTRYPADRGLSDRTSCITFARSVYVSPGCSCTTTARAGVPRGHSAVSPAVAEPRPSDSARPMLGITSTVDVDSRTASNDNQREPDCPLSVMTSTEADSNTTHWPV